VAAAEAGTRWRHSCSAISARMTRQFRLCECPEASPAVPVIPIVQFARAIQAASAQRCSRRASARRGSPTCGSTPHASRCHIAVDGPTAIGPSCRWRPSAWACLVRLEMAMFAPPVSAYRLSAFFSRDCFSADGLPNEISFEVRPAKCVPAPILLIYSRTPGSRGRRGALCACLGSLSTKL
jgi:hypothetical protein